MGKYYCLIAGLPNIALDDSKLTYSISQFRQELDGILTVSYTHLTLPTNSRV